MRIFLLLLCFFPLPLAAGEYAILANGFRLRAERHEIRDSEVILYARTGGVTRLPATMVAAFEVEEYVAPAEGTALKAAGQVALPAAGMPAGELIKRAVARQKLPAEMSRLAHSVAEVESGLRQDAVSRKGAVGVMQLMPATAAALNADPRNPEQNVDAGVRYLRDLLIKYQGYGDEQVARALAAYNAGPAAVDRYQGIPPYPETQRYVRKVIEKYQKGQPGGGGE
jgi:hypothetical protein